MHTSLKIVSGSISDRGLSEKRPQNEDSFLEMREVGVFAVADGVGGAQAGEVASQMAMEILAEAFTNFPDGADAASVMRAAIERSNTAIFQMAYELPQLSNMATTFVAVHLADTVATIGHVGDSRVYRVNKSGELFRETDDHSMVAEEVRAGRMTEEQAETHPSRNVISRALGAESTVEPELKTILIEPGSAILLCSDGVTRHVGDQEIKGVLTFGGEPADICEYLKHLCYERGAEDNLTAVVIKVYDETPSNGHQTNEIGLTGEESTVAIARQFNSSVVSDGTEQLLELDTADLSTLRIGDEIPLELDLNKMHGADSEVPARPILEGSPNDRPIVPVPLPQRVAHDESESGSGPQLGKFSMFGSSSPSNAEAENAGFGKVAGYLGMLLAGALAGLATYHFLLTPPQPVVGPPLTEMQSSNQQLSAFEENRRTVDRMPAEALAQFGKDPRDAEDYFLVGRAQLLVGQYPESKRSFMESRARITAGDVDQNNRKTIETEIAIAMAVLNDSTVQGILKSQLSPPAPATDVNSMVSP